MSVGTFSWCESMDSIRGRKFKWSMEPSCQESSSPSLPTCTVAHWKKLIRSFMRKWVENKQIIDDYAAINTVKAYKPSSIGSGFGLVSPWKEWICGFESKFHPYSAFHSLRRHHRVSLGKKLFNVSLHLTHPLLLTPPSRSPFTLYKITILNQHFRSRSTTPLRRWMRTGFSSVFLSHPKLIPKFGEF